MSKLLEDPKVKALVDREVSKAVKEERRRTLGILKEATAAVKSPVSADADE